MCVPGMLKVLFTTGAASSLVVDALGWQSNAQEAAPIFGVAWQVGFDCTCECQ